MLASTLTGSKTSGMGCLPSSQSRLTSLPADRTSGCDLRHYLRDETDGAAMATPVIKGLPLAERH
jgi:hypothetical protein